MAATIRDVLVRVKMDVQRSESLRGEAAKLKAEATAERTSAAAIGRDKLKAQQAVSRESANERRKEELHLERMRQMRLRTESQVARMRQIERVKDKAFQFQGEGVKGLAATSLGGGAGAMGAAAVVALAVAAIRKAPEAMKGVAADIHGGERAANDGLATGALKSYWGMWGELQLGMASIVREVREAAGTHRTWAGGQALDNMLANGGERFRNAWAAGPIGDVKADKFRPGLLGQAVPRNAQAERVAALQKEESALRENATRLTEVVAKRKELVAAEERLAAEARGTIQSEQQKIESARQDFGSMGGLEQQLALSIARKIADGGKGSLTPREVEFMQEHGAIFGDYNRERVERRADAGNFGALTRDLNLDLGLKGAKELEQVARETKEAKLRAEAAERAEQQFQLEGKITIEANPEKIAAAALKEWQKVARELEARMKLITEDAIVKQQQLHAAQHGF